MYDIVGTTKVQRINRAKEAQAIQELLPKLREGEDESKIVYSEFLDSAIKTFAAEPSILRIDTDRAIIVGDVHGDRRTLVKVMDMFPPKEYTYVLLGDYVDRSYESVETLALLLASKLQNPGNFFMIRGDHESPIGKVFPQHFPGEFREKIGDMQLLQDVYGKLFPNLPMAVVLNNTYFVVHGGIPLKTTIRELESSSKVVDLIDNPEFFQMI